MVLCKLLNDHIISLILKWVKGFRNSGEPFLIVLSVIVGTAGGLSAVFFRWLIGFFQNFFWGLGDKVLAPLGSYHIIILPALGGILVGMLTTYVAREAKGSGIPEVMKAVALKDGIIEKRVPLVKALASAISIGSGGSVGREGPIVQISSGIGSSFGQVFRLPSNITKTLVGCGAAAGIAATFNAPISGVLFALEIILGEFKAITFSLLVISSVTASVIAQSLLGNYPAFKVPPYSLVSIMEFFNYLGLGVLASLAGLVFIKMLFFTEDLFNRIKKIPVWLKPMVGGLIIGLIGLNIPEIFGVGYETIGAALDGNIALEALVLLLVIKMFATSVTIGSGGSGGVFAPSLFMGAVLGGSLGNILNYFYPSLTATPGAYALVGMGALVAATTQAPITAIIIIFELTRDYHIILPLMISCVIASLLASRLSNGSIYTIKLLRQGINIKAGRDINILKTIRVKDAMSSQVDTVPIDALVRDVIELMQKTGHTGFPVLSEKGNLVGIITLRDIREIEPADQRLEVPVKEVLTTDVITASPEETLADIFHKLEHEDEAIGRLPVVSPQDKHKLVGLITRSDIVRAYNRALEKREREQ